MTRADIAQRIRQYIIDNFLYMRNEIELGHQDSLLGTGIIDSMGVMELVSYVEEAFAIVVSDADVTEANLGTIDAITSYVESRIEDGIAA